jgi:hypothetical protein
MSEQRNTSSTTEMTRETFEFPMNQAIEYQQTLAQMVLNGLTMGDWFQSRGIELTKQTFNTYLNTLESTSRQLAQAGSSGMQAAEQAGQQMTGVAQGGTPRQQGTQQFQGTTYQRGTQAYQQPPQQPMTRQPATGRRATQPAQRGSFQTRGYQATPTQPQQQARAGPQSQAYGDEPAPAGSATGAGQSTTGSGQQPTTEAEQQPPATQAEGTPPQETEGRQGERITEPQ